MSEYGHFHGHAQGVFFDSWGAGPFLITYGKLGWWFEDSDRFGPALVNPKSGNPTNKPIPPRSFFWEAHRLWVSQGRRIADDGKTCIWAQEDQP